ncbi:MAG TPA: hypothetical protein DD730_09855, partial [Desulfosporosinus sp.]|nr:hypothetical protein [Desulfosporosinus sp.]
MKKKLEKLTKKQTELMEVVKNEWINTALFAGDEINEEKAREGIDWLYEISGLQKPHIVFVDSPMGTQLAVNMVIEMCKGNQTVENSVWNSVRNSV